MMSKVGSQTNSADPMAINSRIFVGNLNTYLVSKEDLERIFKRYGRVAAISMHKGYAFVQYTNPYDARTASNSEDGNIVCGQQLDVNMVTEPKPHQTNRKRPMAATMADCSTTSFTTNAQQRLTPPVKRPRITTTTNLKAVEVSSEPVVVADDILICGNCKDVFTDVLKLEEHKKAPCKLRFACKCAEYKGRDGEPLSVLCAICKQVCTSAWELLQHSQSSHNIVVYELNPESPTDGQNDNGVTMKEDDQ